MQARATDRNSPDDPIVIVVTGASRGLGAGLADRFIERGHAVGLCARSEPPEGGDRVVTAAVDVTDAAAVDAFAEQVSDRLGPISIWINNAGLLGPVAPARDADPDAVRDAVLVNVVGVANGAATFARMARREPGSRHLLVDISSGAATSVYPGWSTYGATKAAVEHLGRHIAAEEPDLHVVSLSPGVVDTDMQAIIRGTDEADFPAVERFRALHRDAAFNSPAWVADHVLALWDGSWRAEGGLARVPDEPRR